MVAMSEACFSGGDLQMNEIYEEDCNPRLELARRLD